MEFDAAIRGGRVVTNGQVCRADVGIRDGKIASVEPHIDSATGREVDATDKLVLPGVIDVHTHPVYLDDLESLPVTAAYGGTTTVIHYAYAKPGEGLLDTVHAFREESEAVSVLDFALHGGLFDPENQSHEIPDAVDLGITSHKMFMTYAKLGWMTDDYQLMRTLDLLGQAGGMGMVHAENGLATDYLEDKSLRSGEDPLESFVSTRPAGLEAEAIHRAIAMARVAGCPLYIPHLTAALGVEEIRAAREEDVFVYAETCPQYLTLTEGALRDQGPLVKIGPPLREEEDRQSLWNGLATGVIDTIASDHAAKDKQRDDDFFDAPFGSPQAETMLSLAYDGGVNGGWLSLPRLVEVMCENPAKIFGLYPTKGTIQVGSDADLVVLDPAAERTLEHSTQHSQAGYTPYEGRTVLGKPVFSMQRGDVLLDDGVLQARPGRARFLPTQSGTMNPRHLSRRSQLTCPR